MGTKFYDSFIGPFVGYVWVNRPDVKYQEGGVYKVSLRGKGAEAEKMAADIETEAQAGLEEHTKEMVLKDKKLWSVHLPFEREEDDNGTPTGYITFDFKQNATITIKKTGEKKSIKVGIYDAEGNDMHSPVYAGSEGRVRYSKRVTPMISSKKVGIRLDFAAVQISKLAESNSSGGGFGKIAGGYVEDSAEGGFTAIGDSKSSQAPAGGDY